MAGRIDVREVPEASPEEVARVVAGNPKSAEDVVARTREEYGTYVAKQQIYSGSALIYNEGDPVPVSAVERFRYHDADMVTKVGTKDHAAFMQGRRELLGLPRLKDLDEILNPSQDKPDK
jgi:hypothetical protein